MTNPEYKLISCRLPTVILNRVEQARISTFPIASKKMFLQYLLLRGLEGIKK